MIKLIIKRPDEIEEKCLFSKNVVSIGRHRTNDIVLIDELVSRFHAEIEFYKNKYYIRDLDSRNGVLINDSPILEQDLANGDVIRIGDAVITFYEVREGEVYDQTKDIVFLEPDETEDAISSKREKSIQTSPELLEKESTSAPFKDSKDLTPLANACFNLSKILQKINDIQSLLEEVLNLIEEYIPIRRAAVLIFSENGKNLKPILTRSEKGKGTSDNKNIEISKTIVDSCLKQRIAIFTPNAMSDSRFSSSETVHNLQIKSVACIPLIGTDKNLGVLYLETGLAKTKFSEEESQFLISIANCVSISIENHLLHEEIFLKENTAFSGNLISSFADYIKRTLSLYKIKSEELKSATEEKDFSKLTPLIDNAISQNQKLSEFLSDVELYTKGHTLIPETVNLNDSIKKIVEDIRQKFAGWAISFSLNLDENIGEISLDKLAIQKSISNIITFQLESLTQVTHPFIEICTESADENNLRIIIQDNGLGISQESLLNIFNPFFSLEHMGNSGLTLAIARRFIKEIGGAIDCESEKGVGTTFVITLPLQK